eukprot:2663735-Alexandrium_andersonii.AAC.1
MLDWPLVWAPEADPSLEPQAKWGRLVAQVTLAAPWQPERRRAMERPTDRPPAPEPAAPSPASRSTTD